MICPVDNSDMVVVEHKKVELDYCTKCRGVWFDSGELELLMESLGLQSHRLFLGDALKLPEAKTAEKRRKCPICRQDMKKTVVGKQPEVHIDVCRNGDGLWFDGGEVGQVLAQMQAPTGEGVNQQLAGFLKDVFQASAKS